MSKAGLGSRLKAAVRVHILRLLGFKARLLVDTRSLTDAAFGLCLNMISGPSYLGYHLTHKHKDVTNDQYPFRENNSCGVSSKGLARLYLNREHTPTPPIS